MYAHAPHALQPPDDEYEPTLHSTHVVEDEAAMELEKEPAGQLAHDEEPGEEEKEPGGHA